jgi:hypothetical protein
LPEFQANFSAVQQEILDANLSKVVEDQTHCFGDEFEIGARKKIIEK